MEDKIPDAENCGSDTWTMADEKQFAPLTFDNLNFIHPVVLENK